MVLDSTNDFHLVLFNFFKNCIHLAPKPLLFRNKDPVFFPSDLSFCCRESMSLVSAVFLCLLCHLSLYWIVFHFISLAPFLLNLLKMYLSRMNHFSSVEWDSACFLPSPCYVYHEISIFILWLRSFLRIFSQSFLFPSCPRSSVLKFLMACSSTIF